MSSAEGTGFPMKFSAHRSDSSDLFMHSASDEGVSERGEPPAVGSHFVVIRACSTIPSKRDGENTVEEGRVSCQKGGDGNHTKLSPTDTLNFYLIKQCNVRYALCN